MFEYINKIISLITTSIGTKMKFHNFNVRILAIIILLSITYQTSAQSFNYGLKVGVGKFNQNWEFDNLPFSGWKNDKTGITAFIFGELNHNNQFGTKLELGFLKKGYYNDLSFEAPDGTIYDNNNSFTVDYKTLYLGLTERISFFKSNLRPYINIGMNFQLIQPGDIENQYLSVVEKTGNILWFGDNSNHSSSLDWNILTLNANVGLGLTYKDLLFIEFEYSPALTPLLNIDDVKVYDRYFGLSVGLNINHLF